MNPDFARSVRSASFNLSLSDSMIQTILVAEIEQARYGYFNLTSKGSQNSLYRRGLIRKATKEELDQAREDTGLPVSNFESNQPQWDIKFRFTRAGELVVGMLQEADFRLSPENEDFHNFLQSAFAPQDDEPEFQLQLKKHPSVPPAT